MRIKKIAPVTPANGNIENSYGTSQENTYSQEYLNGIITMKKYTETIENNAYVSPYGAYGQITIQASEIQLYGDIISVCSNNQSNAPMPCTWIKQQNGNYILTLVSNNQYKDMTVRVYFCKLGVDIIN